MKEIYSVGYISRVFYDENLYPLDRDKDINAWRLTNNADRLTYSKVPYRTPVIARKEVYIRLYINAMYKNRQNFMMLQFYYLIEHGHWTKTRLNGSG